MQAHLLDLIENSRNYTLAVVAAMPDRNFDVKPADGIWNFRELICHIAYGIHWWEHNYIKRVKTAWNEPPAKSSRKETVETLNQAYDALRKSINDIKIDEDVIKGFYATLDHITHHRGQAVIYLRSQGIAPPEYVY